MNQTRTTKVHADDLSEWLIRDLVERYPETLAVLAPFGIDLCCGGGRALGEALDLHGAPREETLSTIEEIVKRRSNMVVEAGAA